MKKELAHNLEGVIGDFLDAGKDDLPYNVIEDLAEHVAGWILAHKKELMAQLNEAHRKLMQR